MKPPKFKAGDICVDHRDMYIGWKFKVIKVLKYAYEYEITQPEGLVSESTMKILSFDKNVRKITKLDEVLK
jgi:hypothetical protein